MSGCVTECFSTIAKNRFNNVVATLKQEGSETASTPKKGTGPKKRISDEARATVKDLAVSPVLGTISHKLPFQTLNELGFLGQNTVLKCTDDILSIYECNITYAFNPLREISFYRIELLQKTF